MLDARSWRPLPAMEATVSRLSGLVALTSLVLSGCVITPDGTREERDRATRQGARYEPKFEQRVLPDLPAAPSWRDVLRRSFLANGELEAAYFQWRAALERVTVAGTWPNTNVSLGYEYMFGGEAMKSFDRSTFSGGFDTADTLVLPTKTARAAKVALSEALAAGERFRVVKFEIQKRVMQGWADYVLHARLIDAKREELALRRTEAATAAIQSANGGGQQRIVEAQFSEVAARNDLDDLLAEHASMRAMLNALMHRVSGAALGVPREAEERRRLPPNDAELIALAADEFPEVAVFAREVEGRRDALELARMRWIPDISPSVAFTGSVTQSIGAMFTLPTTVPAIRASIREAEAELRAAEAMVRQKRSDRVGEYVSLLLALRRAEQREAFLKESLVPAAKRIGDARRRAYEAGSANLSEVVDSQQILIEARVAIARAEATIEKSIADIECCLGRDIETLGTGEHP